MEQQASAGDFKKNVLLLKPGDVTKRGDHVLTPTLNILSKLRKTEQFKRDVVFSRNMSAVDVTKKLVEAFPALENKRFSCAKRDNRESANLNFKGDRHVWDGETIKKLPGSSAMYIVVEDETSQVQAAANETDCLSADQRPSSFTPLDLEGVNPGRFDDYWKDLVDVLNEDCKNSDGLRSRQSQTMQMVSGRKISESSERYRIVVNNDEISETGYSSGANSSQAQGFSQETEATDTTQSSFRLYQARETAYSSDEGISFKEQTFDLTINPESCRPEGGKSFSMEFNKSLPSSVTSAWAIFGPYGRVKVSRSYDEDCTLFGKKIPPGQPGTIIVKITTEGGAYLGETDFTYKNPKKKLIHQGLSNKRKLDELYAAVKDLEKKVKQIQQGDNDEENQTSSFEQGLVNQGKNLKPERILKLLIYAAAEAGAMRLIETIFSLPAGRIVFEVYKDDSALPEDIAEENGHREVAVYLRGVTERYSEEHCTSPDQSTVAEFDWLKLANALEGIKLKHTGPSSYKDLNQIWEDETGYSADGETSSSGSEKEISDSEDELNMINTCKDHPYHEGGKRSLGNSRGSYCDSREKRSDLEVSKRNLCKESTRREDEKQRQPTLLLEKESSEGLDKGWYCSHWLSNCDKAMTTSQTKKALPDQPNVQPPHGDELGSGMVSSREIQENEIYPQENTSPFKAKKKSEKEVLVCYGGNNNINENFTHILTKKDKHQTWSSSFKDDDIADYTEAEVGIDDDDEQLRLPSSADVDEPGISFEFDALNASSSVERSRATFSTVDKDHRHEETETTEKENTEVSQKDQERYGKGDGTVFNQQLESRSLKTKKRASTETGSSAQSNFLREDERKKGPSNSEASDNDNESESTSDLNGGERRQSIEEDKAISGTILNQAENTASRYKLNNNVTQKEKDMTERAQEDDSKVLNQELSSVSKSKDKRMKVALKVTGDSAENTTSSNNEMEEGISSSKGITWIADNERRAEESHLDYRINAFEKEIREMKSQLVSLEAKGSRMSARIKELKEERSMMSARIKELEEENQQLRATVEIKDRGEREQEISQVEQVLRTGNKSEELEEQLLIARQLSQQKEEEDGAFLSDADQADREHRIGAQLKNINEQLNTYVTSPLQTPLVKQDQLRLAVRLDLLVRLSENLQELYTETQGMISQAVKCNEDLRRDYYDLAYHGLRAEHFDLVHRVEDLESAQEDMSEEERKEYERLQSYQKDRQRQVEALDKVWRHLFSPVGRLPKTTASDPTGSKSRGCKKVLRLTDPSYLLKKLKLREEIQALKGLQPATMKNQKKTLVSCVKRDPQLETPFSPSSPERRRVVKNRALMSLTC